MPLSYTQQVFQDISKKYFPYSSFNDNVEGNFNSNPLTFIPDTYHAPVDNFSYLIKGGQFLYRADYRNPTDFDTKRWIIRNLNKYFDDKISMFANYQLSLLEWNMKNAPDRLSGHKAIPIAFSGRLYNKASSVRAFRLMRATRDEFSKLAYYIPADYLKYCSENHDALNKCFDEHLTQEMEEDREIPEACKSLYEDVNISCGLRRMQVMSRIFSNFDSVLQIPTFSIMDRY